jgi:hypothetical protein
MGVGVTIVWFPVGGPAGVAYAGVCVEVFADEAFFQVCYFSFLFVNAEAVVQEGDAGAVIAAVFETFEAFQDNRISFAGSDISNNATHRNSKFFDSTNNITVLFSNRGWRE